MTPPASLLVARTEVRRTLRVFAGNRTKVALMAVVALVGFGPMAAVGVLLLPGLGEAVAAGGVGERAGLDVRASVTGLTALLWLGFATMATMRTVTTRGDVDEPACVLLATSTRSVVLGLIGTELVLFAIWVLPFTVVLAGAFAYGFGSVLPLALVLVLLALLWLTAVPVGFLVGIWIRHLLTTYEPVARLRTPLAVLLGAAYFGAIFLGWFDRLVATLFSLLGDSPLGWPGEVLLVTVPGASPSAIGLAGTGLLVALGAPLALTASVASAEIHWFADEVSSDDGASEVRSSNRLDRLLSAVDDRAIRTVSITAIRRAKRAPVRLLYVVYPLFGFLAFGEGIVSSGSVSPFVAVVLCGYVVWGAGVLFTLNVLGDYGRALPAVLTTPVSGRQAVGGTILAGALVSVPVALLVSTALGLASPLALRSTGLLAVGTVLGAVASPVLATGIGALFPRFGSVRITSNREAVMPSKSAFVVYTLALAVPTGAAVVLYTDSAGGVAVVVSLLLSLAPAVDLSIGPDVVAGLARIVLGLAALAPFASVWYAARRFDRLELD